MTKEDKQEKLEKLLEAYTSYFDITRNVTVDDVTFAALATYHSRSGKYILVKSAKIWSIEMNEYVYFSLVDRLDVRLLSTLYENARNAGLKQIKPHNEHMYSHVSLVILADHIDEEAKKALRRLRFRKTFRLSLHGWMEFRIAAICFSTGEIISNPAGKNVRETLQRNLQPK